MGTKLLDNPYREDPRVIELFVLAEVSQRILRNYNITLEQENCRIGIISEILSRRYPYSQEDLLCRDIRYHIGKFKGSDDGSFGDHGLQESLNLFIRYLDLHFEMNNTNRYPECDNLKDKILTAIFSEIVMRFSLDGNTEESIDLASDELYCQSLVPLCKMAEFGRYLASYFYVGVGDKNPSENIIDECLYIGTRIPAASMVGRPVIYTTEHSGNKAIYFNLRSFNAYYQYIAHFLFFHEIASHYWANLRACQNGGFLEQMLVPQVSLGLFEEAFVHWTSIYYLDHYAFSELVSPRMSRTREIDEELKRISYPLSFGDIRESFLVYEFYFRSRYEYNSLEFRRACCTARGLRVCIQLFIGELRSDIDVSWEILRHLVIDINMLKISTVEKDAIIQALYYLVAPFGDKYLWIDHEAGHHFEVEVDALLQEHTRGVLRKILDTCWTGNRVDAIGFIRELREIDRLDTINQIIHKWRNV